MSHRAGAPRPIAALVVAAAAGLTFASVAGVAAAMIPVALPAVSEPAFVTLTASSMTVTDFVYSGTSTSADGATLLDFAASTASLTAPTFAAPCDPAGVTVRRSAASATVTALSMHVQSLTATVGGSPVTFDSTSPPSASPPYTFPSPLVLTDVSAVGTEIDAGQLSASALGVESSSCQPSANATTSSTS